MSDAVHYVEEPVLRYSPRTVVVYEGDNDTSAGKRSQQLLEDYQEFVEAVLAAQPSTRIVIRVDFVDVGTAMLGADGLPIPELFVSDALHMTAAGYDIWDEILMEALMPGHMHGAHMAGHSGGH